jgi:N-methylhydantoinase B
MMARSERQMRSYIEELPDGTYAMEDCFDNDGVEDKVLPVVLKVTVAGSALHFDFTGTAPAARGPMNMSESTTRSLCYVALKHLFPEVPVNGGAFRPVTFTIPKGSIFAAAYPSPCNGYTEVVQRVIDVSFGALAKAMPERAPAAPFGTTGVCTMSGRHPATGRYYVAVYPYPGGYGGSAEGDGLVNGTPPGSMASFMSIEMSEHRYPIRFERHAIREDSGGPGRHRGGCGTTYAITALADCTVSVLGDRVDHAPFGIEGGESGAPNRVEFRTGGETWQAPLRSKYDKLAMKAGEGIAFYTPGGGGFGHPFARELGAIEEDLDRGFVSPETAQARYGAVIAEARPVGEGRARHRLDAEATARRRAEPAKP